uniref:Potassium channel domain-containing protein n=2 Tax=Acrobeloides nanus TaxID=290746 RepID=A0A914DZT8_9BILA
MNEELHVKELDGLLESPGHRQRKSWKQYVKLTLPHVALVTFVCIYAMAGAWVFYTIESPHEDRLKVRGVEWVDHLRKELLHLMWNKSRIPDGSAKAAWASTMSGKLKLFNENLYKAYKGQYLFNENLYKAYKGQYVRYGDIRVSKTPLNEQQQQRVTLLKHRSMKSQHPGGKLWTRSSALFFAATTMATIGYGNIVPVTAEGRIACVVFALFGAPLAIITIGDLGKFMSECTIWLYKKIKEIRQALGIKWRMWKLRKSGVVAEIDEELSIHQSLEGSESNQEDETEVPVLLVFAILLLYMALGGILFAFLESWTYVDAFYFCFVSLTTIGFGDLVPDRHEFIVIMLIYLGVGLAVTTMCIDLVGIQYLLKRKRAIERKLAMGDVGGAVNMIHQIMEETEPPRKRTFLKSASQNISHFNEEKASLRSEPSLTPWTLEGVLVDNTYLYEAEKLPTPELLSGPSPPPSIKSSTISTPLTNSSDSARSRMYDLWRNMERGGSIESGPDISIHCSISTSPSVYERENLYENYRSPQPSLMSFQFTFPIPIDFRAIAEVARRARRVLSCPSLLNRQSSKPPSEPSPPSTISSTPMGLTCMEEWDSYIQMLDESMKPRATSVPSPIPEEPLFVHKDLEFIPLPKPPPPPLPLNRAQEVEFLPYEFEPEPRIIPEVEVELDIEPQVSIVEAEAIAVPSSSVVEPLKLSIGEGDEDVISPVFPDESSDEDTLSPMFEIDLGAFELVDSGISAEALLSNEDPVIFHKDMPVHSVHHDTVQTEAALENLMNAPESMLSHVVPPTMVADNYCFVVDGDRVRMSDVMGDDEWWRHTSRPTKHFYSEDLKKFFKVNVIATKGKIISARIPSGGPAFSAGPSTSHSHSVSASVTSSMMASSASSTLSAPPLTGSYPGTALHSAATTPRSSFAARSSISSFAGRGPRGEKVNLEHVYKVIRVYSFWRTCTSFHRIVTMIDKVVPDLKDTKEFKKRLFVQYLWRNAKPYEKARVQREFDPRSQRILRFVTDPAIKKRVSVMPATTSSRRTQPSTSEETAARQSRTQSRTQSRASSTSSKKSKP